MKQLGIFVLLVLQLFSCTRSSVKNKTEIRRTENQTIQQEEKAKTITEIETIVQSNAPADTFYTTLRFSDNLLEESAYSKTGLHVKGVLGKREDGQVEVKVRVIAPEVSKTETIKVKKIEEKGIVSVRNNELEYLHAEQHKEQQTTGIQTPFKCWLILLILLLLLLCLLWKFRNVLKRFIF